MGEAQIPRAARNPHRGSYLHNIHKHYQHVIEQTRPHSHHGQYTCHLTHLTAAINIANATIQFTPSITLSTFTSLKLPRLILVPSSLPLPHCYFHYLIYQCCRHYHLYSTTSSALSLPLSRLPTSALTTISLPPPPCHSLHLDTYLPTSRI